MWGRYPRMGLRGKISRKSQLLPCQSRGFPRHFTIIQFLDMKSLTGQIRELIHVGLTFDGRWQNAMQHIGWFAHRNDQCLQVPWPEKMIRCTLTTHGASNHHPLSEIQRNMSNQKRSHGLGMVPRFHLANTNNAEAWEVTITHIHPVKFGTFDL